jgi:hypothetical protein
MSMSPKFPFPLRFFNHNAIQVRASLVLNTHRSQNHATFNGSMNVKCRLKTKKLLVKRFNPTSQTYVRSADIISKH